MDQIPREVVRSDLGVEMLKPAARPVAGDAFALLLLADNAMVTREIWLGLQYLSVLVESCNIPHGRRAYGLLGIAGLLLLLELPICELLVELHTLAAAADGDLVVDSFDRLSGCGSISELFLARLCGGIRVTSDPLGTQRERRCRHGVVPRWCISAM